jgi:hypothetical protein
MPNWCECDLYVEGPSEKIDEFLQLVKTEESEFDFDRLIPYPEKYKRLDRIAEEWDKEHPYPWTAEDFSTRPKDGYNQGGYKWCVANWGTKWPARNPITQEISSWRSEGGAEERQVKITFATPWSPPKPVIERGAQLFPGLLFDLRYFEAGAGFNGVFRCEGGEVIADKSADYYGERGG